MKQIRAALDMVADTVGRSKGEIVARRGFFFKGNMDAARFAARVNSALERAGCVERVVEYGEKWAAFRGGQTVAQGSHFWARIG